jgi:phosphoribosylglycinamide formyltransferase-1
MRLVTPVLLDAFPWRVVNIHPALLPAFPGIHAQRQALAYGVKVSGCTVHFVDAGTDSGPVIAQATVEVEDDDTEESLAARILVEEHRLLVGALSAIAADRVRVVEGSPGMRPRVVVTKGRA